MAICSRGLKETTVITLKWIKEATVIVIEWFLKWFFYFLSLITCQFVPDAYKIKFFGKCCIIIVPVYMFIIIIFGVIVNLFPTILFTLDWVLCPINYYNICYTLEFHSSDQDSPEIPEIVLRSEDHDGDYLDREDTRRAVQPFNDLAKFTLLSICLSTFVSYFIFIIGLIRHYFARLLCNISKFDQIYEEYERLPGHEELASVSSGQEDENNASMPHPFNNNDDDSTEAHTKLKFTEHCCFFIFLLLNIVCWAAMVILFFYAQYGVYNEPKKLTNDESRKTYIAKKLEIASAVSYFYSHLCTIVSCFIFSKIMYGIQRKIKEQEQNSNEIIISNNNNVDIGDDHHWNVINNGKEVIANGKNIINGGLHTITGGTNIINGGTNTIIYGTNIINGGINTVNGGTNDIKGGSNIINYGKNNINGTLGKLQVLIKADETFLECATKMLSIFQLWFFLHWMFYIITSFLTIALSIEAILLLIRATQHHMQPGVHFSVYEIPLLVLWSISNVLMFIYPCFQAASITRARKKYIRHLIKKYAKTDTKELVDSYVKYLQSRDFGFRLYVGCTHIPFNLNVAYTSTLIGVFGIVLSVLTSVAT